MNKVRYFDECNWEEIDGGLAHEFRDVEGEKLAEVALVDADAKLWRFEMILPERFQIDGRNSSGVVFSASAAKKVAETILLNTVLIRL